MRGDISELLGRYDIGSRGWRQARSDSGHGDSVTSESYRERACHADQSTLGRYIREHVCTGRTPIRIGHNKDHAAETAISHPGNEGLREQQRRLDIDRLDLTPHLKPEVVEWSEGDHRRRVNKNIASTVAAKYRIRGPPYGFRVAQVNDDLSSPAQGDHGVVRRQTRSDRARSHQNRQSLRQHADCGQRWWDTRALRSRIRLIRARRLVWPPLSQKLSRRTHNRPRPAATTSDSRGASICARLDR